MRLDKYLCQRNMGTRSRVKELIRRGQVTVNGVAVKKAEFSVKEGCDVVCVQGREVTGEKYVYFMLNKPGDVVSAVRDNTAKTVVELLRPEDRRQDIFPAGRLDKDTEGFLLLTNDGDLAHRLLSPRRHVDKTYLVTPERELAEQDILRLEQGVEIGENCPTRPAKIRVLEDGKILLTIHEGKFHQVKRMFQAVGNGVTALKRTAFGGIPLDESLKPGEYRALTEEELRILREAAGEMEGAAEKKDIRTMLQEIDAVIFDLDGSLVDSMWLWRAIDIEYLGRFGIPLPEDLQSKIEGMSFHETAVYFKEVFGIPDSLEEIKADWNRMAWDKYANEVPLKPGIPEFLEDCRSRGIRLGIATSNSRELVENVISVHGIRDFFLCIMSGTDVLRGKPAPDIYLAVAEKLQAEPSRCLVFEDIVPGIQAGKNAGMRVCAVEDVYSEYDRERKLALADYYIEDYRGLFEKA